MISPNFNQNLNTSSLIEQIIKTQNQINRTVGVPLTEDPLTLLDGLASVVFGFGSVATARITPLRRLTVTKLGTDRRTAVNPMAVSFEGKERVNVLLFL